MKKNAIFLLIFSIISKLLGIVRESFLGFYYGVSEISDAYLMSSSIPNTIYAFISAGLVSTFIPIYSKVVRGEGQKRADRYLDNILSLVFVITMILIAFGLLFTEQIVFVFAPKFDDYTRFLTIKYLKITLFAMLSNGVYSIFSGYQQYHNRFLVSPIGGFLMNIVTITSIAVSAYTDPIVLAYGLVIASIAQVVLTYVIARFKSGYRFKPGINLKDEYLKPMLIMALPIIFGSSISQINTTIDRAIASGLSSGTISVLNYSSKVASAAYGLFVTSVTTVMYPSIIKQAAANQTKEIRSTIISVTNTIMLLMIPTAIGMLVLREELILLFYGRGEFLQDPANLKLTAVTLAITGIGVVGTSLKDIMVRVFYAFHNSMSPVFSGIISVVVNVSLNIILAPIFGVYGLAAATAIANIVGFLALYIMLNFKIIKLNNMEVLSTFIKITLSALIMGLVAFLANLYLIDLNYKLRIIFVVPISVIVYAIAIYAFKIKEFQTLIDMVLVKLKLK